MQSGDSWVIDPQIGIAAVTPLLKDSYPVNQVWAAEALAAIGRDARSALPALRAASQVVVVEDAVLHDADERAGRADGDGHGQCRSRPPPARE